MFDILPHHVKNNSSLNWSVPVLVFVRKRILIFYCPFADLLVNIIRPRLETHRYILYDCTHVYCSRRAYATNIFVNFFFFNFSILCLKKSPYCGLIKFGEWLCRQYKIQNLTESLSWINICWKSESMDSHMVVVIIKCEIQFYKKNLF